jgi:excisionase family DNA binding protein
MTAVLPPSSPKQPHIERATYTLAEFARLLGIGYTQAHEAAQRGTLPVMPIRQGRKYLFPRTAVHRLLLIEEGREQDPS